MLRDLRHSEERTADFATYSAITGIYVKMIHKKKEAGNYMLPAKSRKKKKVLQLLFTLYR